MWLLPRDAWSGRRDKTSLMALVRPYRVSQPVGAENLRWKWSGVGGQAGGTSWYAFIALEKGVETTDGWFVALGGNK
jgi:hypothetical protein